MRIKLFIILSVMVLSACNSNDEKLSLDKSQNYFPLFEGKEWVDSTQYIWIDSPSNVHDTTLSVTKTIVDSVHEEGALLKYYCSKYKRNNRVWVIDHVYWYEVSNTQLIRFEDNIMWLDMVFPLSQGKEWNPYAFNVYSDTTLRNTVHSINKTKIIDNFPYDSTLTIYHQMDSTLIYKYTDVSVYASGLGLLLKEKVSIVSDDPNYDYTLPIEERIKIGQFVTVKRSYNYESN